MSAANRNVSPLAIATTLLQGAAELIFLAPIWLTISIYYFSPVTSFIWIMLLLTGYIVPQYVLWKTKRYKNTVKVFWILGGAIFIVFLTNLLATAQIAISGSILSLLFSIYYIYSSMQSFKLSWRHSFTVTAMVIWIIGYLVLQFVEVLWLTKLAAYSFLYNVGGMASFIIFLFMTNERMLSQHQIVDQSSRSFRMSVNINRVILSCVAAILLVLTLLRGVQEEIEQWFRSLLQQIIAWLSSSKQENIAPIIDQSPSPEMEPGEPMIADEPSQLWLYLEMILKILVTTVVVVAIVALILLVGKKLGIAIQSLIAKMMNPFSGRDQQQVSYIDEIEELQPLNKHKMKPKTKSRVQSVRNWAALSDDETVRALYKQLVIEEGKQGYRIDPAATASQTISDISKRRLSQKDLPHAPSEAYEVLKELYDDVRYGEKQVSSTKLKNIFNFFVPKK